MDVNQIATKEDIARLQNLLEKLLAVQQSTPAAGPDDYLSLEQVAELTGFSVRTVKKWCTEGKPDRHGRIIQLFSLEFSPNYLRIPRAALLAYGEARGFSISELKTPPPMRLAG